MTISPWFSPFHQVSVMLLVSMFSLKTRHSNSPIVGQKLLALSWNSVHTVLFSRHLWCEPFPLQLFMLFDWVSWFILSSFFILPISVYASRRIFPFIPPGQICPNQMVLRFYWLYTQVQFKIDFPTFFMLHANSLVPFWFHLFRTALACPKILPVPNKSIILVSKSASYPYIETPNFSIFHTFLVLK